MKRKLIELDDALPGKDIACSYEDGANFVKDFVKSNILEADHTLRSEAVCTSTILSLSIYQSINLSIYSPCFIYLYISTSVFSPNYVSIHVFCRCGHCGTFMDTALPSKCRDGPLYPLWWQYLSTFSYINLSLFQLYIPTHSCLYISIKGGIGVRITVQYNLFTGSVMNLGDDEQVHSLSLFEENAKYKDMCVERGWGEEGRDRDRGGDTVRLGRREGRGNQCFHDLKPPPGKWIYPSTYTLYLWSILSMNKWKLMLCVCVQRETMRGIQARGELGAFFLTEQGAGEERDNVCDRSSMLWDIFLF